MAFSCALLSALAAVGDGKKIYGRVRDARDAATGHHAGERGRAAAGLVRGAFYPGAWKRGSGLKATGRAGDAVPCQVVGQTCVAAANPRKVRGLCRARRWERSHRGLREKDHKWVAEIMVSPLGFEPRTHALKGRCSTS